MTTARLARINIFPVKSTAGIRLSRAWVHPEGLAFDRRFMVALPDGGFVTARRFPQLVRVAGNPTENGLILTYPGLAPLHLRYDGLGRQPVATHVWKDDFNALSTTPEANEWFSDVIGRPCQLLYVGNPVHRHSIKSGQAVTMADGYPLLIISQASLDALNQRASHTQVIERFRTNLLVDGCEAFAEDGWQRLRIGSVEFRIAGRCARCVLTTVDPASGRMDTLKEPLATLAKFRADEDGNVYFGQNLIALNSGEISEGDTVEILETRRAETYPDHSEPRLTLRCVAREPLSRDMETFWFESATADALPAYQAGQHLPLELPTAEGKITRRYTLSSAPASGGRYAISVKRQDGGTGSTWLHTQLYPGTQLTALAPAGQFILADHNAPLLLLSAGSGVTPLLSMLRQLAADGAIGDVVFQHHCRSEADIPAANELATLAGRWPGLDLRLVLSGPTPAWRGLSGRLAADHLASIAKLEERQVYLCGPEGFMRGAVDLLTALGVPSERIHQEHFSPPTVTLGAPKAVRIAIDGRVFEGDNQSPLLPQAEDAGIGLASDCRAGICGTCKLTLVSGTVQQPEASALSAAERAAGRVLACCCVPETDVELTASVME